MLSPCQSHTFEVSDRDVTLFGLTEVSAESVVRQFGGKILAGDLGRELVDLPPFNALMLAVHLAFQRHQPLVLSPDMLWQTLLQGLAHHIRLHSEEMRSLFVEFPDKLRLSTRADPHPTYGAIPWKKAVRNLVSQVAENIKPASWERLQAEFSTTGPTETLCASIALMDVFQNYFDYSLHSMCGIPRITLEGSAEDWSLLRSRFQSWREWGLERWADALDPCLEQFENACRGEVNRLFWGNLYKNGGESGSGGLPILTGWLTLFYPYVRKRFDDEVNMPNKLLEEHPDFFAPLPADLLDVEHLQSPIGLAHRQIPDAVSRVPFRWHVLDQVRDMELRAGLVGVEQNRSTLALRPRLGWAVVEPGSPADPPFEEALRWQQNLEESCAFS